MGPWTGFYSVLGGATATLMGLLFVAVSLNAPATFGRGNEGSSRLAEQAFQNYLAVLVVSLLAMIPGMSTPTFAKVSIGVTALWVVYVLVRFWQTMTAFAGPAQGSRFQSIRRYISSLIGFGMMMSASLLMAFDQLNESNLFAAAAIVLLFSATEVSWAFLKRVAQVEAQS